MLAITLSVALLFAAAISATRLPFPRDWIVGGAIAANFAFQALIIELCARDLGGPIFWTGFAMLVLDASLLLYLVAKALTELPNPDLSRAWSSLAYATCAVALIGAPFLGRRMSCPIYFWLHRAELEEVASEDPQSPRVVRSVPLGFMSDVHFIYDPTHGHTKIWHEGAPYEESQRLSDAWYARTIR